MAKTYKDMLRSRPGDETESKIRRLVERDSRRKTKLLLRTRYTGDTEEVLTFHKAMDRRYAQ